MPICIHCSAPIDSLYMRYGRSHVVLSPCPICSSSSPVLADEYLEHDLPIVIIDLILAKPKAYRHLLFNRASLFTPSPSTSTASSGRRGSGGVVGNLWTVGKRILALGLVDAYIRWFYLCVQPTSRGSNVVEGRIKGKLSGRAVGWLQEKLPLQAGVFFPSLFTPTPRGPGEGWEALEGPIRTVCSPTPLWMAGGIGTARAGETGTTLVSYLNVLCVTLVEGLALHLCVGLLSSLAVRVLPTLPSSTSASPHPNPTPTTPPKNPSHPLHLDPDPFLANKALLLAQVSPLLLLTFLLLWSNPHNANLPIQDDRSWLVWIIRTFLASLNAGVAIRTVLPQTKSAQWSPPAILATAWAVQAATSTALYAWLL